jgi:tetratricopeptide (TPR) repeat protein
MSTLRALTAGSRLDQRRALLVVRQVLEALASVHATGGVHGELTPDTIVVTPGLGDDRVELSEIAARPTGAARAGDPLYSAPESALGMTDPRSDIYAAGAVLYELLTGHPPFFADDAAALRRLHAYAPIQRLEQRVPDLPFVELLEPIVAKALAKKRDARFQSAGDMIAALDPVLQAIDDAAAAAPRPEPQPAQDNSLLLLAKDLMPQAAAYGQAVNEPLVPLNVDRQVPQLPWTARVPKKLLAGVVVALAVGALVAIATCAGGVTPRRQRVDVAQQAKALFDRGKRGEAIELIEREIAARPSDPRAHLLLGDTYAALGHDTRALTAYAKAIDLLPAVATEEPVRASLRAITARAATSPDPDVRHRAVQLAERTGLSAQIDRVQSWMLDLDQATECEQRRAVIGKLSATADPRAVPALQRAKADPCAEPDATAAIERISGAAKHR